MNPAFLGMVGMHGRASANHAVQNCDVLMVVGARFDDRATGQLNRFAPSARVIHLDIDPAEISKLRRADVSVVGELAAGAGCTQRQNRGQQAMAKPVHPMEKRIRLALRRAR